MYDVTALLQSASIFRHSVKDLPEEAEHAVIEVREAKVGGGDPDIERVTDELRQELLSLTVVAVSEANQETKRQALT